MNKRRVPLVCVLLALALVLVATRLYPGGTLEDSTSVGFDWWRNYLTQLFRPMALNGEPNAARPFAIAGVWLFCIGMAELFRQLANGMGSTRHATWVRIFGIASAVYAALTVTRMHDLMVAIASGFTVAADIVLLDWIWRRRHLPQWVAGMANLALMLATVFVYEAHVMWTVLPTLQKLSFLSSAAWLFRLHKSNDVELSRLSPQV